jgi:hypothetical protein
MLKMIKGCKIESANILHEQYVKNNNLLAANVDADKIEEVLRHFILEQNGPIFFILELPCSVYEEKEIGSEGLHKNVYYIDGLDADKAILLLRGKGELLVNDGLCSFGFGSHFGGDEIMVGKYNVVTIYSRSLEKYAGFFEQHNIPETKNLITAWDTFTHENPGVSEKYEVNGKDVYTIVDDLKDWGIYLAEQRDE